MSRLPTSITPAHQQQIDALVDAIRRGDSLAIVEAMARLAGTGLLDGLATALWVDRVVDWAAAAPARDPLTEVEIAAMVETVTGVPARDGMFGDITVKAIMDLAWLAAADREWTSQLLLVVLGLQAARHG